MKHYPKWEVRLHLDADLYYQSYILLALKKLAQQSEVRLSQETRWPWSHKKYPHDPFVILMRVRPIGRQTDWTTLAYDARDQNYTFCPSALSMVDLYFKSSYYQPEVDKLPEHVRSKVRPGGLYLPVQAILSTRDYWTTLIRTTVSAFFPLDQDAFREALKPVSKTKGRRFIYLAQRVRYAYIVRLPLQEYEAAAGSAPNKEQVFFNPNAWDMERFEHVNLARAHIMRILRDSSQINFVGGFRNNSTSQAHFSDILCTPDLNHRDYIRTIGQSEIVLNTRGLFDCFSWKLPEYMAAGRCILSERLVNELPQPLREGEELLFFDFDPELVSFQDQLNLLIENPELRQYLAANARKYYEQYVEPCAAMRRILSEATGLDGLP